MDNKQTIQAALKAADKAIDLLAQQRDEAKNENARLRDENERLRQNNALLGKEVRKWQDKIQAKAKRIAELESELNAIKAQAEDATEYVLAQVNKDLRAENVRLEQAIKDAPCPKHNSYMAGYGQCYCCQCAYGLHRTSKCDCWKHKALGSVLIWRVV